MKRRFWYTKPMHGLVFLKMVRQTGLVIITLLISITSSSQGAQFPETDAPVCQFTSQVDHLVAQTGRAEWANWIAQLSGERSVFIDGEFTRILTRYSPAMFEGRANAQAYTFILDQLRQWYPDRLIEEDPYLFDGKTWKNLIVEIPGVLHSEQLVVLSAHLDSISQEPTISAPGASDNGSGVAALLEAARIFRYFRFENSLRFIFFTGEEQGLIGSKAYVRDHSLQGIMGVINLDMFGFDKDDDRCFELHVGTLAASAPLGQCFQSALSIYQSDLRVDYLNGYDMRFSDHASFWDQNIGALEVLENFSYNASQNGCLGIRDQNPNYHRTSDTLDNLNLDTGFAIARISMATASSLAHPQSACFEEAPDLSLDPISGAIQLSWNALPGAEGYQVYRSVHGCSQGWERLLSSEYPSARDTQVSAGRIYSYQVEAVKDAGACVSLPSPCASASTPVNFKNQQAQPK